MADEILKRDQNHITVLAGVTDDADKDIRMLRVDPITKELLVKATGGGGGGAVDSVNGLTGVVSIGLQSVTGVGATTTIESTFSGGLITNQVKANSSAGLLLEASNATDIGLLGAGNTANVAWYGSHTFAGNLIVDTDTLYVDASTNRVGLGLTNATHQLHVRGAGQATANLTDAGATGATIFLQDTGASNSNGGAVIFGANGQSWSAIKGIYTSGAGNGLGDLVISTRRLSADTALTEAIRVTSGGNMTIGSPFVVYSNSQFSIRTNTNLNLAITGFNGAPELFSINDAFNAYTELRINGSPLLLNGASTGNIQMAVGGGNVGVRVASPTYIFTVGSGTTVGSAAAPAISIGNLATGIYLAGSQLAFTQAGLLKAYFDLSNRFVVDTGELRLSAGVLVAQGTGNSSFVGNLVAGTGSTAGQLNATSSLATKVTAIFRGATSQSGDLLQLQNAVGTVLTDFTANGAWQPASLADGSAANGTVYFSTTASRLAYKDAGGTVNNLY